MSVEHGTNRRIELPDDHAHILSSGDYSSYTVHGVFRPGEEETLEEEVARLASVEDDWTVECVPWVDGAQLAARPDPVPFLSHSIDVRLDGTTKDHGMGEYAGTFDPVERQADHEEGAHWATITRPVSVGRRAVVSTWGPAYLEIRVAGTDFDRVRKTFSEERARAVADPAGAIIAALVREVATWDGRLSTSAADHAEHLIRCAREGTGPEFAAALEKALGG